MNGLCRLLGCPCDSPKGRGTGDINLYLLDEVEINLISDEVSSDAQAEFVELLLGCNAPVLKKGGHQHVVHLPFHKGGYVREDLRNLSPE